MRLFDLNVTVDYILNDEKDHKTGKPKPGATTWKLRALRSSEMGSLDDAMLDFSQATIAPVTADDGTQTAAITRPVMDMSGRERNRVRLGVVGWEGLTGADGKDVAYVPEPFYVGAKSVTGVPMEIIDAMPRDVLRELSAKIEELSTLRPSQGN